MPEARPLSAGAGNRNDQTRRDNLSTVMTLLHHDGPQSRARLTAMTGLNRSTIAGLVAELTQLGVTYETEPESTASVGRPSPMVRLRDDVVAVAVIPEVDAVSVSIVGLGGEVLARSRVANATVPTAGEASDIAALTIAALLADLPTRFGPIVRVVGIGVAVPGLVRAEDGLVRWAPHLGWEDEPFAAMLERATGLPVRVGNDASLGAMAEKIHGAGRSVADLIYLNGGASGIGGGIIAGGIALGGHGGYAGEFGHIRVSTTDGSYDDPETGSLESEVNRAALVDVLGLGDDVTDDQLATALDAAHHNEAVRNEVHRQLEHLSTSLRNAVNVLNPELIVLGGFLALLFGFDPDFLETRVEAQAIHVSWEGVSIVPAALGNDLLAIGAAELAFQGLLADPAAIAVSSGE